MKTATAKFLTFIARAFMFGCGFRVAAATAFAIFCIFFGQAKADSLNPFVGFVGNVLSVFMFFDVWLAWPNKALYDLVSDRELDYRPQPYLAVTLPLCILAGTLFVGALLVGAKALIERWKARASAKHSG